MGSQIKIIPPQLPKFHQTSKKEIKPGSERSQFNFPIFVLSFRSCAHPKLLGFNKNHASISEAAHSEVSVLFRTFCCCSREITLKDKGPSKLPDLHLLRAKVWTISAVWSGDNVRQDKQQQECGNQCYLSPLPLCPLHIQLSVEKIPQQHKSQAKLLALRDTMFTDAGWENSLFPCLLDFWRYHLTSSRIAIGKSYFRNHYNASQALDFLMWCSVQRFPVCSAVSLYFKPFAKP